MWSGKKYSTGMAILVIFVMSVPVAAQLADTPWPMFHHDLNHTGLSTGYGPDTSVVNWTFSTGDRISGSVAIGEDGTIYIGTRNYLMPKTDSKLYAIYPNGTKKWRWTPPHHIHFIDSTPAVASDGTIYVGSWDRCLYAIYPNGTEKWAFCAPCGGFVLSSSAVAPDGTIYIGNHNRRLYAIYPNGTEKWNYRTECTIQSSPAVGSDDTIYIGSYDKKLYAIYPNGTEKWNYRTGCWIMSSPAIDADGTIFVGSNDKKLYAIYPNGTLKWSYTTCDKIKSSPAIDADGTVYVGSKDGRVYAINPNGTLLWNYYTGNKVLYSSPAIAADGTVYIGNWGGNLYAFGPGTQPPGTPNIPPLLDPIGDKTINETETVVIDLNATDSDGDTLTYSCNRTDLFTDFDSSTGTGNWTTGYMDSESYRIDFGVSDGKGGIDNETIWITVMDANMLPIFGVFGGDECREVGEQFDILVNISPLGVPLMGAQFDLHYNKDAIHVLTVKLGDFLDPPTSITHSNIVNSAGIVSFAASRTDTIGMTESGTFAVVHCRAVGQGATSQLNLTDVVVYDNSTPIMKEVMVETCNDSVEICSNARPVPVARSDFAYNNMGDKVANRAYFNGTGSYDDGSITTYSWWFGDGQNSVGSAPEHVFNVRMYWDGVCGSGHYVPANVTLVVTDDGMPLMDNMAYIYVTVWIGGDANGDGVVNIGDSVMIGYYWGATCNTNADGLRWYDNPAADMADMNDDGSVNIGDTIPVGYCWGHTAW